MLPAERALVTDSGYDAEIHTADQDFRVFPSVRWRTAISATYTTNSGSRDHPRLRRNRLAHCQPSVHLRRSELRR